MFFFASLLVCTRIAGWGQLDLDTIQQHWHGTCVGCVLSFFRFSGRFFFGVLAPRGFVLKTAPFGGVKATVGLPSRRHGSYVGGACVRASSSLALYLAGGVRFVLLPEGHFFSEKSNKGRRESHVASPRAPLPQLRSFLNRPEAAAQDAPCVRVLVVHRRVRFSAELKACDVMASTRVLA